MWCSTSKLGTLWLRMNFDDELCSCFSPYWAQLKPTFSGRGEALEFQAGYHPRKRTFKTHPNTYFSGMKIDPKYAFCMCFSQFVRHVLFKICQYDQRHTLFSNFARFCTPKRYTRVHCLVLKNNPNYVIFFTRMISNFKYKCPPPGPCHSFRGTVGLYMYMKSICNAQVCICNAHLSNWFSPMLPY